MSKAANLAKRNRREFYKLLPELLAACPDTGKVEKTALSFLP